MLSVRSYEKIKKRQELEALAKLSSLSVESFKLTRHGQPPAAAEAAPTAEQWIDWRKITCPSPYEILAAGHEMIFVDFVQMGVYDLFMVVAVFGITVYSIRQMLLYLQSSLDLQLPSTQSMLHVIFDFADRHPILALTINFGVAFLIGWAFLYNKELSAWYEEMRLKCQQRSRSGVADDVTAEGSVATELHNRYTRLEEGTSRERTSAAAEGSDAEAPAEESLMEQRRKLAAELRLVRDSLLSLSNHCPSSDLWIATLPSAALPSVLLPDAPSPPPRLPVCAFGALLRPPSSCG